jgi:hypothetical protein
MLRIYEIIVYTYTHTSHNILLLWPITVEEGLCKLRPISNFLCKLRPGYILYIRKLRPRYILYIRKLRPGYIFVHMPI